MAIRTVTIERRRGKRQPLILTLGDRPEDVEGVLSAKDGATILFRDRFSGYYLGTQGKFVRNRGHATRYSPDEARKKLAKGYGSGRTHWEAS